MPEEVALPTGIEKLSPELAARVIEIAAAHQLHLQAMDRADVELAKRGQWIAALLSVFFGVVALSVTLTGHDAVGGTIAGTTIVAIASAFIIGRRKS